MRLNKWLIYPLMITLLFSMSGCMATKAYEELKPVKNEAIVYVYRPESLIYRGTPYVLYIDGKEVGTIINNSYLPFRLQEGKHSFELKENTYFRALVDKKVYYLKSNKVYYIRINSGLYGTFSIEEVSDAVGSQEIKKTLLYLDSQK